MIEDRDIEVQHDAQSFAAELRRLADALDAGEAYTIHVEGEDVTVPADALLFVEHESEDGEVELSFQVAWSTLSEDDGAEEEEEEEMAEE